MFGAWADHASLMEWCDNGELSGVNLQRIVMRLSSVDRQVIQLMTCSLDQQP